MNDAFGAQPSELGGAEGPQLRSPSRPNYARLGSEAAARSRRNERQVPGLARPKPAIRLPARCGRSGRSCRPSRPARAGCARPPDSPARRHRPPRRGRCRRTPDRPPRVPARQRHQNRGNPQPATVPQQRGNSQPAHGRRERSTPPAAHRELHVAHDHPSSDPARRRTPGWRPRSLYYNIRCEGRVGPPPPHAPPLTRTMDLIRNPECDSR